jgi:preprotein translocase subunit SecY
VFTITTMVIIMTAGTSVIMWLGELITDRGIGNGMSVMIFTQIIAVVPSQLQLVYEDKGGFTFTIVLIMGVALIAFVALMEQAQRRIPIQYAKRMVGRKMYGGTSTYIPLKINQAGVIPVIFASSLLYIPQLVAQLFAHGANGATPTTGWAGWIENNLTFNTQVHSAYAIAYLLLILFFTYFYVSITFNPEEVADGMKKGGGFIPGIRPGGPTAGYLSHVLSRLTAAGSLYLGLVALIPLIAVGLLDATQQFPLGGTSILIMVGVGLDTVKQLESQLQQRNYEGFLR